MRHATLCFLIRGDEVLLAMKKRGFGVGKWNGAGGKVAEGETIEEAALRELAEEVGVSAPLSDLRKVGSVRFFFENNPDWDQHVHVFVLERWDGEPQESEEMRPQWYRQSELPFREMWEDDAHWLPLILAGKKVEGDFYFDGAGSAMQRFDLRELEE